MSYMHRFLKELCTCKWVVIIILIYKLFGKLFILELYAIFYFVGLNANVIKVCIKCCRIFGFNMNGEFSMLLK